MRIRWTEPAARDLTQICDYIEEHDGRVAARRVALTIYHGVGSLAKFPNRGRQGRKENTRELVFPGLPFWPFTACVRMSLKSTASCMVHKTGLRSPRREKQRGMQRVFIPHGGNRRHSDVTS